MLVINLILVLLIVIGIVMLRRPEKFTQKTETQSSPFLKIKKTNTFRLVHKTKDFFVWEAYPIDHYFPIGQVYTKTAEPPSFLDTLVFNGEKVAKAKDYELVSMTTGNMKIWKPIVPTGFGIVSYIFSKKKPSLNKFKYLPLVFLRKTTANVCVNDCKNYSSWNIFNSNYIYCYDKINKVTRKHTLYFLDETKVAPERKLLVSLTMNYIKLYENEKIGIWRPIPPKDYRILGDCVFKAGKNPNNKISVATVHKSFATPIIDYHDSPVCKIDNVRIWNPNSANNTTTLGHIITLTEKEPNSNLVSSIPLEYVLRNDNLESMDDSLPRDTDKYNIFANQKHLLSHNDYKLPNTAFKLNMDYCNFEKIITEIPIDFRLKIDGNIDINDIKETLSQRTGNPRERFIDARMFEKDTISLTVSAKPVNSKEDTPEDIINTIQELLKKKPIQVDEETEIVSLFLSPKLDKNKIKLDNSEFTQNK